MNPGIHKVDPRAVHNAEWVVPSPAWAVLRAEASAVLKDWADKARAPAVPKVIRAVVPVLRARTTWAVDQARALRAKDSKVAIPAVAVA